MNFKNVNHITVVADLDPDSDGEYCVSIHINLSEKSYKKAKLIYGLDYQDIMYYMYAYSKSSILSAISSLPTEFIIDDEYHLPPQIYTDLLGSIIDFDRFTKGPLNRNISIDPYQIIDFINDSDSNDIMFEKLIEHHNNINSTLKKFKKECSLHNYNSQGD